MTRDVPSEPPGIVVDDLRVDGRTRGADIVDDVSFARRAGHGARHRRRVRQRQDDAGDGAARLRAAGHAHRRRPRAHRRAPTSWRSTNASCGALRGRAIVVRAAEPGARAQPRHARRRADRSSCSRSHRPGREPSTTLRRGRLGEAQLPARAALLRRYPHQLSGGQHQRVAIAMALVCRPAGDRHGRADDRPRRDHPGAAARRDREPAQRRETRIVYVSHDLGVVRNLADRRGRHVRRARSSRQAPSTRCSSDPQHPYTRRLLEAIPRVRRPRAPTLRGIPGTRSSRGTGRRAARSRRAATTAIAAVRRGCRRALVTDRTNGTSCAAGGVGELAAPAPSSGTARAGAAPRARRRPRRRRCSRSSDLVAGYRGRGSSATGRGAVRSTASRSSVAAAACLAHRRRERQRQDDARALHRRPARADARARCAPTAQPLRRSPRRATRRCAARIQIVFQDPDSSLNPSMTVGRSSAVRCASSSDSRSRRSERARVAELLERVSCRRRCEPLPARAQRRREAARRDRPRARGRAELLICDEVTSALDVAVQASILELLGELRAATGMSMLFVSHDLARRAHRSATTSPSCETVSCARARRRRPSSPHRKTTTAARSWQLFLTCVTRITRRAARRSWPGSRRRPRRGDAGTSGVSESISRARRWASVMTNPSSRGATASPIR